MAHKSPGESAGSTPVPGGHVFRIAIALAAVSGAVVALAAIAVWQFGRPTARERALAILSDEARAALSRTEETNRELERRIVDVRRTLRSQPQCGPGTVRRGPDGRALVPPPTEDSASPVEPVAREGAMRALGTDQLLEKLERATAVVLHGKGLGTGFFISDRLLVTNRHVVEASDGRVLVASRALGAARRGTVIRTTEGSQPGTPDFALIRLDEGAAPDRLAVTERIGKLRPIVAAGYPGLITLQDAAFQRLVRGDATSAPDLNLTQGVVQSLQSSPGGLPVVVHTASILQGNSGGPLVDACGRLVAVNTFGRLDPKQVGRVSFAQASPALLAFMAPAGGGLAADARSCEAP